MNLKNILTFHNFCSDVFFGRGWRKTYKDCIHQRNHLGPTWTGACSQWFEAQALWILNQWDSTGSLEVSWPNPNSTTSSSSVTILEKTSMSLVYFLFPQSLVSLLWASRISFLCSCSSAAFSDARSLFDHSQSSFTHLYYYCGISYNYWHRLLSPHIGILNCTQRTK
jgi:hypothetical protein